MRKIVIAIAGVFVLMNSGVLHAQSPLKGSRTAMKKQNKVAQLQDYTFLRTSTDVKRFVDNGYLVPVSNNSALKLADVSYPYARPAVKTFAERLAMQYKNACGNKLVVTSLTRPVSRQPRNAHELSVHPAGMALDIRVSEKRACRSWLESTLVSLEKKGILEATRERNPAHYHVAVFPSTYMHYLGKQQQPKIAKVSQPKYASVVPLSAPSARPTTPTAKPAAPAIKLTTPAAKPTTHTVQLGESLWSIAQRHGISVSALKDANGLGSTRIRAGQVLAIPRARSSHAD